MRILDSRAPVFISHTTPVIVVNLGIKVILILSGVFTNIVTCLVSYLNPSAVARMV